MTSIVPLSSVLNPPLIFRESFVSWVMWILWAGIEHQTSWLVVIGNNFNNSTSTYAIHWLASSRQCSQCPRTSSIVASCCPRFLPLLVLNSWGAMDDNETYLAILKLLCCIILLLEAYTNIKLYLLSNQLFWIANYYWIANYD